MITNCPGCALVFRKNYPRILGEKWQIEVKLVIEVLDKTIQKKHPDNQKEPQKITYHDPCHLGRQQGVYQLPRKILKKLGFEVVEMEATGKDSFCCGAGGGVNSNNPDLSKRIGEDRVAQAQTTKAQILTTNCPMCHYQLVKGLKELKEDKNLKAKEFSDLILEAQS
jgi:heterodisulfide reductase subunit D